MIGLDLAVEALAADVESVEAIGERLGFASYEAFKRRLRAEAGLTPRQLRGRALPRPTRA